MMDFSRLSDLLFESNKSEQRINLFYGSRYTTGQNAFGQNEKEVAAKDPVSTLEILPVYNMTPEIEEFFGRKIGDVTLQQDISGSYHERWAMCGATTIIQVTTSEWKEWEERLEESENLQAINAYVTDSREERIVPYVSMRQIEDELNEFVFSYTPKNTVRPGEDREQYWSRMIERYKAGAK